MEQKPTLWTKNFTIITIGTVISAIGGVAMNFALGIIVFSETDSTFLTALYTAVCILPALILSITLAPFVDTHSRKKMIVYLDCAMGLMYLCFGFYISKTGFSYGAYVVLGALGSSIGSVYSSAYNALYPDLIPEGFMQKGYSVSSIIYPTISVVITPLAALIYEKFAIEVLFFGEGALLLIASAFETQIKVEEKQAQNRKRFRPKEYLDEILAGARYLKKERGVRSLYTYMAITNATAGATDLMARSYFMTAPGLNVGMYALLVSAETLGRMLGGIVHYIWKIPVKKRYKLAETVYKLYDTLDGAMLFLPYFGMAIVRFLCGFLGVNSATLRQTAIQQYLPADVRARVNSLLDVVIEAGMMLLQLVAGVLGEFLPYRLVAVVFAVIGLSAVFLVVVRNKASIEPLFLIDGSSPEKPSKDAADDA